MTTESPARKPRPRPARRIHLHVRPDGQLPGAVEIAVGTRASATYLLTPLVSDFGAAYRLERLGPDGTAASYDVSLGDDGRTSCECAGFLYRGRCKHVEGLQALRAAGKL